MRKALQLGRAVQLVWQSSPRYLLINAVLLICQSLLPLAGILLLKLIVDGVTNAVGAADKSEAFVHVGWLIALAAAVGIASAILQALSNLVRVSQEQVVTNHMHNLLHAKSVEADLEYYENAQYFDTLHMAQQEAPHRPASVVNGLMQFTQNALSLVGILALLFTLHWTLTLVLLIGAVPAILVRLKFARRTFDWERNATPEERRAWYLNWVLISSEHAKEVRLYNLGELFTRQFLNLRERLRKQRLSLAVRQSTAELVTTTAGTLAVFGAFAYIAYRAVQGAISVGDLVMFYQAFHRGQACLMDMMRGLASLYEDSLFLSAFYDFLGIERRVAEPENPQPVPAPAQAGISFEHVSFRYPGGTRPVLEDVSLTLRPRQVVALVGENGSGKTTLIKLLCRLYDPTGGRITLDGTDLRQYGINELRRQFSVLLQDYVHYNLEARENIRLGNIELEPDDTLIVEAAREAGIDGVISKLPQGYATTLGRWFENGEELSVGEWQRVALARAFVRDAQFIIMDEPTSALDAHNEFEVFEHFRRMAQGRAALVISHRLSTVRMADWIYVLKDGRITEGGTHDQLIQLDGTYARLFQTQAQYYRDSDPHQLLSHPTDRKDS